MKRVFTSISLFFIVILAFAGNNQLNIDGVLFNIDTLAQAKVGPGTYYTALKYYTSTKSLRTFVLAIDVTNPYIRFESVLAKDSLVGTERVSAMASRKSKPGNVYFAGVNADFFATTGGVGTPTHGCMTGGQIGRAPAGSPVIAFAGNQPVIADISFGPSTCTFGSESFTIQSVNATRETNQLILYNTMNGNYTHTNAYGTEVLVQLQESNAWGVNQTLSAKVVSIESKKGNMKILPDHAVLSGHGTAETFLSQLKINDEIKISLGVNVPGLTPAPSIHAMVGGDRMILKDGIVTNNDWADLHPRTCAGYSQDKKTVYFCVVDGRTGLSAGVRTKELADIIKSVGAYDAVNLDGGGSSALYVEALGIVNNPSDGTERAVGNAMYALNVAPEDALITEIRPELPSISLPRYGAYIPVFYAYNQYGTLIDTDLKGAHLSCDSSLGTIHDGNMFVASGTQSGYLYASYNGMTTSIAISLNTDVVPFLRLDSIVADQKHPYPIEVNAWVGNTSISVFPQAFTWTSDNPSICSVENGVVTGISNGTTSVHGHLENITLTQKVKVEIPSSSSISMSGLTDFSKWKIYASSNMKNPELTSFILPFAIRYTYTSGRSPYIQLYNIMPLYGIPDSMRIVFNTQNIGIPSIEITMRANPAKTYTPLVFNKIESGTDFTLNVPMSMLLEDVEDRVSYPIHFEGIRFNVDATTQVANQVYDILIKEFVLLYGDDQVSIFNPSLMKGLRVYPNPVTNGIASIGFLAGVPQNIRMELFDLSGRKIREQSAFSFSGSETVLDLQGISSGSYLVRIHFDGKEEIVKIIVNNQ